MIAGCMPAFNPLASTETVNLTNNADGANRDAGATAVLVDSAITRHATRVRQRPPTSSPRWR